MIFTLKIAITGWHVVLEVDSSTALNELHLAIQDAVKFDQDHMYEFFIARTKTSRDKKHFDMEDGRLDTTRVASSDIDALLEELLVDACGDDEQLTAIHEGMEPEHQRSAK